MHLIGSSLSCKREGKLIFSELSFKVSSGEICFIKGPNGSGKSTLLRLLAGFIKVSSGEITLDNKKITNKNDVIYENFFYLGHNNPLKNYLTVKQQIDFWEGISQIKYNLELDSFNLKRIMNRKIYECSEGQKKRLPESVSLSRSFPQRLNSLFRSKFLCIPFLLSHYVCYFII